MFASQMLTVMVKLHADCNKKLAFLHTDPGSIGIQFSSCRGVVLFFQQTHILFANHFPFFESE